MLVLAGMNELQTARKLLEPLIPLGIVFGDYELLSRVGRVLKDFGDRAWEAQPQFSPLQPGTVSAQYYSKACEFYTTAFLISGNYFPGVNAATLTCLLGHPEEAGQLAEQVLDLCKAKPLTVQGNELYWLFASQGEAALVSGRPDATAKAVSYFDQALGAVEAGQIGMVQSTWKQVCRLWETLGKEKVQPVADAFRKHKGIWNSLQPGPLGNCGFGQCMSVGRREFQRRFSQRPAG